MASPLVQEKLAGLPIMLSLEEDLRRAAVAAFVEASQLALVPAGTPLFDEGEHGTDYGYVLLEGSLAVTQSSGFAATVRPPALLGEMKQFHIKGADERMASVRTAEDTTLLRFRWADVYRALEARVTPSAMEAFREAVERYAWMHFLELEDEL